MAKETAKENKIRIASLINAELICEGGVTLLPRQILECTEEFAKPLLERGFVEILKTKEA